jgi:predicted transglutaminase-like cysteine proteinase
MNTFALNEHLASENGFQNNMLSVYGEQAHKRAKSLLALLDTLNGATDLVKIQGVNDFVNRAIRYRSDMDIWEKQDYWATPFESIGRGHGDCEDYAIAKYFILLEAGVKKEKLRIMYVKRVGIKVPHMVLAYYPSENDSYILDNVNVALLKRGERDDLMPVFSFNQSGVWITRANTLDKKVPDHEGVGKFKVLVERMDRQKGLLLN